MAAVAEAFVVDASVAAKWHLQDEDNADRALVLLERFVMGQVALWAPSHIRFEVPAVITHATVGRPPRVSQEVAKESIEAFLALGIQTVDTSDVIIAAFPLVHQYGIAFYDAVYIALAQQLDLPFITADRRLNDRIRESAAGYVGGRLFLSLNGVGEESYFDVSVEGTAENVTVVLNGVGLEGLS